MFPNKHLTSSTNKSIDQQQTHKQIIFTKGHLFLSHSLSDAAIIISIIIIIAGTQNPRLYNTQSFPSGIHESLRCLARDQTK